MSVAESLQRRRVTSSPVGQLLGTVRRTRWFLIALHVPFVLVPPVIAPTFSEDPMSSPFILVPVALGIGGLQLRHSFAAARGERPRHWPWTLLALAALVYLPMVWLTWSWFTALWFVIGSAAMLLPRPLASIVITVQVPISLLLHHPPFASEMLPPLTLSWMVAYHAAILLMGGGSLYGAARLVRAVDELYEARAELAEVAVGRERLRISRDLHDLLGHSLSAVSLKGDLAIRLMGSDPQAARSELDSMTEVARDALRDVRAVTRGEREVSFLTEAEGAAALLAAAGIDARIDADFPHLAPPVDNVLGWAVREGVTNVLQHSEACACTITAEQRDGRVTLEIVNDGARAPAEEGSGLTGLAERARALLGSASAEHTRDGRFRLRVEVPLEIP